MPSTAFATGGGTSISGRSVMSSARKDYSFPVTFVFSMIGLAISLCFIDLPTADAAASQYTLAFTVACQQAM
jgi:hypothetical protein